MRHAAPLPHAPSARQESSRPRQAAGTASSAPSASSAAAPPPRRAAPVRPARACSWAPPIATRSRRALRVASSGTRTTRAATLARTANTPPPAR
jgi:hypothetical protein